MTKKTIILGNLVLISALILLYYFYPKYSIEKLDSEITIFTLEPLLGIHAKMITNQDAHVYIFPGQTLSREARIQLQKSDVILSSNSLSQSEIGKELQSYKWLYITIPSWDNYNQKTHSVTMLNSQVELIRDALSDTYPDWRGFYYDNAGNYTHLLNTTFKSFRARIEEYSPTHFITLGDNLNNLLVTLGVERFRMKHYNTLNEFVIGEEVSEFLVSNNIRSLFTSIPLDEREILTIQNKYNIVVYELPALVDDTSRWWYIRFAGKMINDFVAAFDTYD